VLCILSRYLVLLSCGGRANSRQSYLAEGQVAKLLSNSTKFDWQKRWQQLEGHPMLVVFMLSAVGLLLVQSLPLDWPWASITAIGLFMILFGTWWSPTRDWRWLLLAVIPCLACWRSQLHQRSIEHDLLFSMAAETSAPVVLECIAESPPRYRPDLYQFRDAPLDEDLQNDQKWETHFEARVVAVRDGRKWLHDRYGTMTISAKGRLRNVLPGDRLRCYMEWQRINPPTNPGQFDLAAKYQKLGLRVRGRTEDIQQVVFLQSEEIWRFDRWLAWIGVRADMAFHRYVPFGQATLASALVLGQRDQVEWSMQESLLETGTIHMLAISGMHIEMVAVSVFFTCLVLKLPRRLTLSVIMVVVVSYSLLCGGNPPVARAAIVVVTLCLCGWNYKTTRPMNLLGLAGSVILLYRPTYWLEIGTQLSFLAVMVLIWLRPNVEMLSQTKASFDSLLAESHPWWQRCLTYLVTTCREFLVSSFWVWWLTAPLVLYRFHLLSPIAVVLNLILWLPLLLALLSGLALLVVSWLGPWAGYPVGWFCGLNLAITDWIVRQAAEIPGGHFWIHGPSLRWLFVFYVVLIACVAIFGFSRYQKRWLLSGSLLWMSSVVLPFWISKYEWMPQAWKTPSNNLLTITFIDVGHGTCVLMRTPGGQTWLYDAGRMGNAQRSYQGIADVLWHDQVTHLDGIFLSHADSDHYNAIPGLMKRFRIGKLVTTRPTFYSSNDHLQEILAVARARDVELIEVNIEDTLSIDQVKCSFLHPPIDPVTGNNNANSLCVWLEYAGQRILLPGDLEKAGLRALTAQPSRQTTLLMAPHHGSLAEPPNLLLDWARPEVVVISGGSRTRQPTIKPAFGAPNRTVLATSQDHAVRCQFSIENGYRLDTWQAGKWRPFDGK
jgi:competence protein ComEC